MRNKIKNQASFKYINPCDRYKTVLKFYLWYVLNSHRDRLGKLHLRRKVGYKTFKSNPSDREGILNTRCSKLVRLRLSFKKYKLK